jgi:hypothetical protein
VTNEVKVQLLCEGACNPNLMAIDQMVKDCRLPDGRVVLSEVAQSLQRSLVYTEHVMTTGALAKCSACGVVRWFGRTW